MPFQDIEIGSAANDGTGDNPRAAAIKLNANAAAGNQLETDLGVTQAATTALTSRVVDLENAPTGADTSLLLTDSDAQRTARDLGADWDLEAEATTSLIGTTFINGGSGVIGQYPAGAGLYTLIITRSGAAGGAEGRLITVHASIGSRTFQRAEVEGVWGSWLELGVDPEILTQDGATRQALDLGATPWTEQLATGIYSQTVTSGTDAARAYPYEQADPLLWTTEIVRTGTLTGRVTASASYGAGTVEGERRHTWEMDLTLTSGGATEWTVRGWQERQMTAERRFVDELQIEPWAEYEFYLVAGQSNPVGVTHTKPDGEQGALDLYGEDAPHPRAFETSRAAARTPFTKGPNRSYHVLRNYSAADPVNGGIGFANTFCKERLRMFPGIKKIVIINRAVGATRMSDGWVGTSANASGVGAVAGGTHYNSAIDEGRRFYYENPEFRFAGILWHQGESDTGANGNDPEDAGSTQLQYEANVAAMVAGIRAYIPGGADAPFICGTMSKAWRDDPTANGQATVASVDVIHQAHLNVQEYVPNSRVVNLDDLELEQTDTIHFGRRNLRTMGRRYAQAIAPLLDFSDDLPAHLMRYDPLRRRYVNLIDEAGEVFEPRYATDPDRGTVLTTDDGAGGWAGFNCDLVTSFQAYTIAAWVKPAAGETQSNIAAFFAHGDQPNAMLLLWSRIGHGNYADISANAAFNTLTADTWAHIIVSYSGTTMRYWIDGVEGGSSPFTVSGLPGIGSIQLGQWDTQAAFRGRFDEILVLPHAADNNGAQAIYNAANT